jgi:hypothetical protein
MLLQRAFVYIPVIADTILADAVAINLANYAGGIFIMPAASANTSVQFWVSQDGTENGTYAQFETAKSVTASTLKAYEIPTGLFGASWVKFVVVGGSDTTIHLLLKS